MEELKKVKKVDAPDFMLTRIYAKISANEAEKTPVSWKYTGALAFTLLLLLNVFLGFGIVPDHAGTKSLVEAMKLQPDNQLYDE